MLYDIWLNPDNDYVCVVERRLRESMNGVMRLVEKDLVRSEAIRIVRQENVGKTALCTL